MYSSPTKSLHMNGTGDARVKRSIFCRHVRFYIHVRNGHASTPFAHTPRLRPRRNQKMSETLRKTPANHHQNRTDNTTSLVDTANHPAPQRRAELHQHVFLPPLALTHASALSTARQTAWHSDITDVMSPHGVHRLDGGHR